MAHLLHVGLLRFPDTPESIAHLGSCKVLNAFEKNLLFDFRLVFVQHKLIILSMLRMSCIPFWKLADIVLGLFRVFIS